MLPCIVLVEPSHPGNIGAVARAMKNMTHQELRLVNPTKFPDSEASARAASACDILNNAKCFSNLEQSLTDCDLVLALSNRPRTLNWPVYTPKEAVEKFLYTQKKIAIVFGRESNGLSNEELNLCHAQVTIPANKNYGSLNLSHAVQLIVYEFYNFTLQNSNAKKVDDTKELVLHKDLMQLKTHLTKTLINLPFFNKYNSAHTLNRIFCLINRAQPNKSELNLLHGILSAVDKLLNRSN